MIFSNRIFFLACLMLICVIHSGCALIQLPFQALGMAVGAAGKAAQVGIAAAPYAAPFFL